MRKIALWFSILLIVFLFLFMRHYLELAVSVETWMLGKGLMLHKDYVAFHFPLVRLALLPFHQLFNWDLRIEPFFGLLTGIGSAWIIYLFGKKFLSNVGTAVSLIFFSVFFWFYATGISFYHEMVIGFLLALSLYFYYSKKWLLTGFALSLSLFSGQVSFISVGAFAFLLMLDKNARKNLISISVGFLIPALALIIYYASNNALYEFYRWNILYYLTYAGYSKSLPADQIQDIVASYIPVISFFLLLLIPKVRSEIISLKFLPIFILAVSSIPFNFLSVFHFHHLSYSLPIIAIAAGVLFSLNRKNKATQTILAASAFVFIGICIFSILPWYKNRLVVRPDFKIANDVMPGDNMDQTINWVKENTKEAETLMVFGDSLFYVRSNRLPAVRASAGMPYAWEPFDEVKREILNSPSDYWIVDEQFKNRFLKNYNKQEMVDFMDDELSRCYKLVREFPLWQVWKRHCKE